MNDPQPLSGNPMFKIVDQAIRKEISWHEARARLHDLVIEEPDLFAAVDTQIVQDLREDQGADQADADTEVPGTNHRQH